MTVIPDNDDLGFPDLGEVCCMGSAVYGPGRCTCWVAVYDRDQALPRPGEMQPRARMCNDCAFRQDSPERRGEKFAAHAGPGELDELVCSGRVFACHQGMRKVLRYEHPSGAVFVPPGDDYEPPNVDGVAYRADGSTAELCAGIAAERAHRGLAAGVAQR